MSLFIYLWVESFARVQVEWEGYYPIKSQSTNGEKVLGRVNPIDYREWPNRTCGLTLWAGLGRPDFENMKNKLSLPLLWKDWNYFLCFLQHRPSRSHPENAPEFADNYWDALGVCISFFYLWQRLCHGKTSDVLVFQWWRFVSLFDLLFELLGVLEKSGFRLLVLDIIAALFCFHVFSWLPNRALLQIVKIFILVSVTFRTTWYAKTCFCFLTFSGLTEHTSHSRRKLILGICYFSRRW